MDTTLLDQVAQLQQDFRLMRMTVDVLQARVDELEVPLREQAKAEGRPCAVHRPGRPVGRSRLQS